MRRIDAADFRVFDEQGIGNRGALQVGHQPTKFQSVRAVDWLAGIDRAAQERAKGTDSATDGSPQRDGLKSLIPGLRTYSHTRQTLSLGRSKSPTTIRFHYYPLCHKKGRNLGLCSTGKKGSKWGSGG